MLAHIKNGTQQFTAPAMEKILWWQEKNLSFTTTGYGKKIPTRYMAQINGKWRRIYCRQFSNVSTCFVGDLKNAATDLIVTHVI